MADPLDSAPLRSRPLGPLPFRSRGAAALALLALLGFALVFQGARGLWEPDEGRYTNVALEMLRSGDWLIPELHPEQPHLTKPPLTYWAIAASMALLGRNEWAVRLPNALAFAGTVLAVLALGRRLARERPWLPALVYATSVLPCAAAAVVTTDTLLALWETLGVLGYVAALCEADARLRRRWVRVSWVAWGLAFLTKGPPGLLPLAAIGVFALLARRRTELPRLADPLGIGAFLALALGWFVAASLRVPGLLAYLLRVEVVQRAVSGSHHRNAAWYGGFQVYLPVLVLGTLPWTWTCLKALRRVPELARRRFWGRGLREDPSGVLLALWFLLPVSVFFLARSRLPLYLLPSFAPLALLVGRRLAPVLDPRRPLWRAALAAWVAALLALRGASALVSDHENSREYARALAAAVQRPFDEVVFVDTRPHYGLGLYLDVTVESIDVDPAPPAGWPPVDRGLAHELTEDERRVFVVPEGRLSAFESEIGSRDLRCERWGRRDDELFLTLEPGLPER